MTDDVTFTAVTDTPNIEWLFILGRAFRFVGMDWREATPEEYAELRQSKGSNVGNR